MDDRLYIFFGKDLIQILLVQKVQLVKAQLFSRDFHHAIQGFLTGIYKVVNDNNLIARIQKLNASMAADKAGAAGH